MQADGTNGKVLTDSMKLRGSPAWEPDGKSITTAAEVQGVPHLFPRAASPGRADGVGARIFDRPGVDA